MAIRLIPTSTNAFRADNDGDTWILADGNLLTSNDKSFDFKISMTTSCSFWGTSQRPT